MTKLLRIFFCCLGMLALYPCPAQPIDTPKNYLDYYHAVAAAEEAVVNGNYSSALDSYYKVFAIYPYNNPIDCYIAAQVASYMRDTAACIAFLYKGISFGLPVQTILENPHLELCFTKADRHIVDSCQALYQASIDQKARAIMISLIRTDQAVVHSLPLDELYDYRQGGRLLKSKYQPLWDSLLQKVMMITRISGFPAQKIIGTQNGDDSLFRVGPNAVFVSYIFIHHCNAWSQTGDILWQELQKGNLTPQMYGVIYESSNGRHSYENPIRYLASRTCQDRKCKKLVRENLPEINAARRKIGMCSYEVMEKKFESRYQYYKWCKEMPRKNMPYFDFQCELGFQALH